MNIKELLSEKFPNENAICVLTKVKFDYLIKTETSLPWKISYDKAIRYNKIIIVGLGGEKNTRGEYIVADIDKIYTVAEIKKLYQEKNLTEKLEKFIEAEKQLPKNWNAVFSEINLNISKKADERLVILFNSKSFKKGVLKEEFKGLSNPIFYIHKHNIERTFVSNNNENQFEEKEIPTNELLKISKLKTSNFINFAQIEEEFSPNINLIIGKNNTGKTSFIKFLYSSIKALEEFDKSSYKTDYKVLLSLKISKVFQSEKGLNSIVRNLSENSLLTQNTFSYENETEMLNFSIGKTAEKEISKFSFSDKIYLEEKTDKFPDFNAVFLPAKELLTAFKIIRNAFLNGEFGFDATYNDTIKSIITSFKQKGITKEFIEIIPIIEEKILEGQIEQDLRKDKFLYVNKKGEKFEMTMTAEGIKQLGVIPTLINTGELRKGTILFLDEPDNNLNPVAIREFIDVLIMLSRAGVQIFLTTHNYFVMNRLHLIARKDKDLAIKYFSLYENEEDLIEIESGFLNDNLPGNDIIDEAVDIANEDMNLDIAEL